MIINIVSSGKKITLFSLLKNIKRKQRTPRHLLINTSDVPSVLLPTVGGIGWKQPRGLKNCLSCKGILSCASTSHSAQKPLMLQSLQRITATFWHRWQDPGLPSIAIKVSTIWLRIPAQFSETCPILECQLDSVTSLTELLSNSSHLSRASCKPDVSRNK